MVINCKNLDGIEFRDCTGSLYKFKDIGSEDKIQIMKGDKPFRMEAINYCARHIRNVNWKLVDHNYLERIKPKRI